jgi:formylglycine-generating enzyme required for sulfatase activity
MNKKQALKIFSGTDATDKEALRVRYQELKKQIAEKIEQSESKATRNELNEQLNELDDAYIVLHAMKADSAGELSGKDLIFQLFLLFAFMALIVLKIINQSQPEPPKIGIDMSWVPKGENLRAPPVSPDSSETESEKVNNISAFDHDENSIADKNLERAMIEAQRFDYTDSTLGLNLQMIYICAKANDSSHVGSNSGGKDQYPEHKVKADNYYLGKYEITNKQWRLVMGNNPGYFAGCGSCPVENVSWFEVQLFIEKLNELSGLNYRLPSEAEWEIATRGGDAPHDSLANYANEDVGIPNWHFNRAWYAANSSRRTLEVGQKKPSNRLFDMSGNVLEWCEDDWHDNYEGAPSDGTAWIDGTRAAYRVARGRSWKDDIILDYQIYRHKLDPKKKYNNVGFRLARDADEVL